MPSLKKVAEHVVSQCGPLYVLTKKERERGERKHGRDTEREREKSAICLLPKWSKWPCVVHMCGRGQGTWAIFCLLLDPFIWDLDQLQSIGGSDWCSILGCSCIKSGLSCWATTCSIHSFMHSLSGDANEYIFHCNITFPFQMTENMVSILS